ncbi:MAG: type III-B CRISPR module RAMP protein Cmr1, partial [Armatimonadetes bacterium]|nr:type III-B CRISPR module RAMP protein Cmr1 [Armatimonadota bacterium]
MKQLKVTLETITPLFLGGANPRGDPELRAPSFRGVMRFWLRALLGGVVGDNPQEIFKRESAVFGSTEHASSVVVRVNHQLPQPVGYSKLTANKTGLAYLLFSARGTRTEPERTAVPAGKTLELKLQFRSGSQDDLSLKAALASLWLLTRFGGVGSRSRRGGGNLQVLSVQGEVPSSLPSLQLGAKTPGELQEELAKGLSQLREWAAKAFNGSLQPKFSDQPEFDVLHPDFCKIWVVDRTFNKWDEALNEFG